ncbi:hypothetical protein [Plesiomonas shigelloides]
MKLVKVVQDSERGAIDSCKVDFALSTYDSYVFTRNFLKCYDELNDPLDALLNIHANLMKATASMFGGAGLAPSKDDEIQRLNAVINKQKGMMEQIVPALLVDLQAKCRITEVITLSEVLDKYPNSRDYSVGVYTLHPLDDNRLTRLADYHRNLAVEKMDELVILLGRMGARKILVKSLKQSEQHSSVTCDIKYRGMGGRTLYDFFSGTNIKKEMSVEFEGKEVLIDKDLLNKSVWFKNDSKMHAIFEARRFNGNKIKKYSIITDYKNSYGYDFNLAAKALGAEVDLSKEFCNLSQELHEFLVEF